MSKTLKYNDYSLTYDEYLLGYENVNGTVKNKHDYSKDYLTFEALEDNTEFRFNMYVECDGVKNISYSIDGGKTWITTVNETQNHYILVSLLNAGDKVLWKGEHGPGTYSVYYAGAEGGDSTTFFGHFSSNKDYICYGNIMSLAYGDNFEDKYELNYTSEFHALFIEYYGNHHLLNAENLILPATTLSLSCYSNMFNDCSKLTTAPNLPALTLVSHCYSAMFSGCTSLNYIKAMFTTAPSGSYTLSWVGYVSPTGTFVKNSAAEWDVTGANGIPSGWTVIESNE